MSSLVRAQKTQVGSSQLAKNIHRADGQGIIQVDQVVRTTSRTLNLEKMFEAVAIQEKVVPCPALHFSQPVKSVQPIRVLSCLDHARKKTKKTI